MAARPTGLSEPVMLPDLLRRTAGGMCGQDLSCGNEGRGRMSIYLDGTNLTVQVRDLTDRLADAEGALARIDALCSGFDGCPVGPETIAEMAREALSRIRRVAQVEGGAELMDFLSARPTTRTLTHG